MTPQELKNSILQLAIQGKLVEQRPEEGTAEELYQQIQVEKQRLINIGKIKKEKSLSDITEDEIPFDIPESWKWVRLGDIYRITMGQSPDGESISESTCGLEFHQGKMFFGEDYLQKSNQVTDKPTKIAEPNSVLLCVRAPVGIVNITEREICIGRGLCAISTYANMDAKYVLYSLRSCKADFIKKATGTTFSAITGEVVKNQIIPLPPLAEQKRIVAKIEELLPYIERYEKAWNKLEELNKRFPTDLQKSILQLAIQGKLVEQRPEEGTAEELYQQIQAEKQRLIKEGKIKKEKPLPEITEDEIPFDIPESWFWTKIESVTYTVGNRENQIQTKEILPEGDFPVVSQGQSLIDGYTNQREKVIHNLPLVMFGDHTRNVKYIDFPFVIGADGTKFHKCILVYPKFLYYWMIYASGQLRNRGYARHYVLLKQQLIPLPPLAEQKRIVAKIEELMPLCEKLKRD
jgi:type I restriction enzyme S subunit